MAEEIFNEIEEDLQKERIKKIWYRYRNYITSLILLVVISIGGFQLYNYNKFLSYQKASNEFSFLLKLSQNDTSKALDYIHELENIPSGYSELMDFIKADLYFKIGEKKEAIEILETINNDNTINIHYRNVAHATSILNKNPNEKLLNLIDSNGMKENKFGLNLMEAKISILYSSGKIDEAIKLIDELLSSPNLNSEMKRRFDILQYEFGKL